MLPAAVPQAVKQLNFLQAALNIINKWQVKTSVSFLQTFFKAGFGGFTGPGGEFSLQLVIRC